VHRERDDGLYQPMTYLAFKISQEITVTLLHSLPVSVIIFYTVQLQARLPRSHAACCVTYLLALRPCVDVLYSDPCTSAHTEQLTLTADRA